MRTNMKVAVMAMAVLCLAARASAGRITLDMYDMPSRNLLDAGANTCTAFAVTFSGTPADATVTGCKASDVTSTDPTAAVAFSAAPASPAPCNYPVTVGSPTDSALSGLTATTCNHFTRTWTATSCLPLSGNTATTTYTINPANPPTITADASQSATFACKAASSLPTPANSDASDGSATDGCGNAITPSHTISGYTKTPNKCQATATVTYSASDCAGQAATQKTATLTLTASDSPSVSVTAPSSDLQIVQPTCGQSTTLTGSNSAITAWLAGASYSCDCTSTIGGTCSSSTSFQQVGGTSGAFTSSTSITVPSVTSTTKVGTFTFSASNDCASNSATKDLYICPCQVTTCPVGVYSKGGWKCSNTATKNCVAGAKCSTSSTCVPSGTTAPSSGLATLCTSTYASGCSCADPTNTLSNYVQQLAALYLDVNCGSSTTAATASQFSKTAVAALSGCKYLSSCKSGSTLSLQDIYDCSLAQASTTSGQSAVASCLGSGIVPGIENNNSGCLSLLSSTGGC